MKNTIGIGVLGAGWMGMTHSYAYNQVSDRFYKGKLNIRLIACADEVKERASHTKETYGFEKFTTNWKEIISDPDIDAISITAPNFMHLEMARAASEAGKHIFCEKPVGLNPKETSHIEQSARKGNVLTFVGYNYRWCPMVQHALKLINDGKIGKLTHYRGRFFTMYGSNPYGVLSWRFEREKSGLGSLGDIMSHVADMAHMMAGPITQVVSNTHTFVKKRPLPIPGKGTHFSVGSPGDPMGDVTNEDYVGALVQFKNGVQGNLEVCRAIYGPKCEMSFEVNGTKGAISWDFERMNELQLYLPEESGIHDGYTTILSGPNYPFHEVFVPGDGIGLGYENIKIIEMYHFIKSIVEGKQGKPGFSEALALAEVQDAMMNSWKTRSWESVKSLRQP